MNALEIENLVVRYGRDTAVDGVSLSVQRGRTVGLVGESGSGKSSVGNAVVGLVRPASGTIRVEGVDVAARGGEAARARRRTQLVFQDPFSALDPRMSIGASIAEATRATGRRWSRDEKAARVRELLAQVHIDPDRAGDRPAEFSGGQRQRITIARALAGEPAVLIADEVTSALDVSVQGTILNLLRELQQRLDLAILFISHNLAVVRYVSDDIYVMRRGQVVEAGETDVLIESPSDPYTRELLAAVPVLGQKMSFDDAGPPSMRLVNVSAGTVQTQTIDGEPVRTAFVKAPVPEPWILTPTGVAGDEVAVHTDHLYAIDRASYDHWAAELGVERSAWNDGHFAENLTLDTLDQTQLRVGDQYRVGTARLVVTGPRVPCWKLTWRLGQPKTFIRRFRLSGHSGAYFGVIEPGVVSAGDELIPVGGGEGRPTVAELSRLCDSSTRITPEDRAIIDTALECEHLSQTVRATLNLKVAAIEREQHAAPGAWTGWRRFEIDDVAKETADVVSFGLRPLDGEALPAARAGQHVVVRLTEPGQDPLVRTWSLSEYAPEPQRYRITVKLRPGGRGSGALVRGHAGGLTVELRAPAGRFHLDGGAFRPVVLVAAGIGITPMMAMIQAHLERGPGMPPLWLLYGTAGPEHTAFRDTLDAISSRHDDFHLHYFFSQSSPGDAPVSLGGAVHCGRITADRIVDVLRGNYLRTPTGPAAIPWFESDIYLCGPAKFNATVRDELVRAGANADLVFVEDFVEATAAAVTVRRRADAVVDFASRGRETVWRAAEEQTLLELAERAGLDLPYECRIGACRTCESRLLDGEVDGPVVVTADGGRRVRLCISYPFSERVVVEPPES